MSTIGNAHLRLLSVYATVVEVKSFAEAARRLKSSRSRVSEQVSQLEVVLGVRLLQRSTRQLIVTSEGAGVYEQARRLPQLLQDIESLVASTEPSGRVAITMNHDTAHKFVLPILEEFQSLYPSIQLDLVLNDERVDIIARSTRSQ
jgi:DNA-binding transcriptional LysR family regulator